MDTGDLLPEGPAPGKRAAATRRGEHWWPVALAILTAAGLHVAPPAPYRVNPDGWSRLSCSSCWPS